MARRRWGMLGLCLGPPLFLPVRPASRIRRCLHSMARARPVVFLQPADSPTPALWASRPQHLDRAAPWAALASAASAAPADPAAAVWERDRGTFPILSAALIRTLSTPWPRSSVSRGISSTV